MSTIHVAIGHTLGAALQGRVSPLVVTDDNLLLGPSSAHAERHRALRARYWNDPAFPDPTHDLGRRGPLCVYLPPSPSGLLSLCLVCSIAVRQARDVLVADIGGGRSAPRGLDPAPAVVLDPAVLGRRAESAAVWSKLQVSFAATLWKLWSRRSPTAFSSFCATGSALHPLFADLSRYHAGMFPRLSGGSLTVARFDELLLRQLSLSWATPVRLVADAIRANAELWAWVSHTGDLYVATRLLAWSNHAGGSLVERREEHPPNPSDLNRWSFRRRPGSESILGSLPALDTAPPVEIGGAVAYDPDHPWVCHAGPGAPHVGELARKYRGG